MVYEEDVKSLKQGMVLLWNEWRKKEELRRGLDGQRTGFIVDLSGIDLSNTNLRGIDLSNANLQGANLSRTDLSGADLRGTDLRGAKLSGASFDQAVFGGTMLAQQDLTDVLHLETIHHETPSRVDCTTVIFPPMSSALTSFLVGTGQSPSLIAALQGRERPFDQGCVNLFLGFIETDQTFADDLRPHLGLLKSTNLTEESISPTQQGKPKIQAIEKADLMILLVSAPFLASPCVQMRILEPGLRRAREGGILVPVIVRPTAWQESPLRKLQPLPTHGLPVNQWPNRDAALYDIAQGLQPLVQNLHARLLAQAAQQRQPDELLAQLLRVRTRIVQQQKTLQGEQAYLHKVQRHLSNAQVLLETHTHQQQALRQSLEALQETETILLHQLKEFDRLGDQDIPCHPPSICKVGKENQRHF